MTQNDDVEEALESIASASASLLAIVSRSLESALGAVSLPQFRLLVILAAAGGCPLRTWPRWQALRHGRSKR